MHLARIHSVVLGAEAVGRNLERDQHQLLVLLTFDDVRKIACRKDAQAETESANR